jgi:hypothetical protein
MDFWNRVLRTERLPQPPASLNAGHITTGYRVYWLKMATGWDAARRATIAQAVAAAIDAPGFAPTDLERRFPVEGLDDRAHSGVSLLALAEVLRALADIDDAPDED